MSTSNTSIAVVASEQQALTQPVTPSQTSAQADVISAAQAEIALTPAQIDKLPVPQFKQQYGLRVKELALVTAERDELATQLKELKPAADRLNDLGGEPFIKEAVDAANHYLTIATIPRGPDGRITQKHKEAGQRFVDMLATISPPSAELMEAVMNDHYGGRAWDGFATALWGRVPSNSEWEATKAFIDGGYQTQTIIAAPQDDALPAYCYTTDDYGNKIEIPEYVALERRKEAKIKGLEAKLESLSEQQNAKTATQKANEERTTAQQEAERLKEYRKAAFKPVEETILTQMPDAATNPKALKLRRLLEVAAEEAGGENLKLGLDHARLNQMGKAHGLLAGLQAKIRVAVAEEALDWIQRQGAPTIDQQLKKVKDADTAISSATAANAIPYRPQRSDYPNDLKGDEKWRYDRAVHRATYKTRFPDEQTYVTQTTRPAAAA